MTLPRLDPVMRFRIACQAGLPAVAYSLRELGSALEDATVAMGSFIKADREVHERLAAHGESVPDS